MAVCKYCGWPNLEWKETAKGWRLFADASMHLCQAKPDGSAVKLWSQKKVVKCKYCSKDGFNWKKNESGEWRLYDAKGEVHLCKDAPKTVAASKSTDPVVSTPITPDNLIEAAKMLDDVIAKTVVDEITSQKEKVAASEPTVNKPTFVFQCVICHVAFSAYEEAASHANSQHTASEKMAVKPMGHNVVKVVWDAYLKIESNADKEVKASAPVPQHVEKAKAKKVKNPDALIDQEKLVESGEIKWHKFYGLPEKETFDLRVLCSNVYAAERILHADPKVIKNAGLEALQQRSYDYIDLWANRFGKYVLASCLGEWRHRNTKGALELVPMAHHAPREAMQTAAVLLWGDSPVLTDAAKPKIAKALQYMAQNFGNIAFFNGSSYGGPKWAKIASTMLRWVTGDIPNVVWLDYIWDVVHNGGRLFDKAQGMFKHETEMRGLLDAKTQNLDGDVRKWGSTFLHKDWNAALETLDAAKADSTKTGGWIGQKLGGQTLYGGD